MEYARWEDPLPLRKRRLRQLERRRHHNGRGKPGNPHVLDHPATPVCNPAAESTPAVRPRSRITESVISDNLTIQSGGGLFIGGSIGLAQLERIAVSGNQAMTTGGGLLVSVSGGEISIVNSTISGNQAGYSGGGITASGDLN